MDISLSYFPSFNEDSKVWVFMAERPLTLTEQEHIKDKLSTFIPDWAAHGNSLEGDFELFYHQFIVVSVDERRAHASGCSIDSLTHVILSLEKDLDLQLTNRMLVAYKMDDSVYTLKLNEFKNKVKQGDLQDISVFNNSVSTLKDFRKAWLLPLKDSWAGMLLK